MIAYYAHCMEIYGTPQEARDIEIIKSLGFTVLNPNEPQHQAGCKGVGMEYFQKLVEESDLLIFRALPDGSVPSGIAKEIEWATIIIELPSCIDRRTLTLDQTRTWLKECGQR